ncbi:integrase [Nocardia sp. 852002-20019_SCH5090214]|uniref:tyrosine-type recombinase/integrase n=2 Tax=Nocardia TaxID=1817 RepID=UPI0007A44EB9|nr:site-specific integrase [Nocardia africana]MCC3311446.1 site-specific integrase [Nocardia africana]OBA60137.1 integrase [Nocardia sp. 852002-20019_SCH5090214]
MTTMTSAETVSAARVLLAQMGLSPADLVESPASVPTFAIIVPQVRTTLKSGTLRTYDTHLRRLETEWAARRLDEPTQADLEDMARAVQERARTNRASRGGGSAVEHFVGAVRCVYRFAEKNGWIRASDNPARKMAKPTRKPSHRYAIPSPRLAEICAVAAATGNDPELDSLILRLHVETACRRSGALALRPHDLDATQCLVWLREKDGTDRWQPVSPTLMRHLLQHAADRGASQSEQLLRYKNGKPISSRRYDHIWARIGEELPWVAVQGVTMHWLRHTTLTWVERTFSYAVARAYAGHDGKTAGTTATYVKANLLEVATALAVLTGEPHPLSTAEGPTAT